MDHVNRIAIIGGTGKVGRYIATKALQNGYQVRMLVRNPEKITDKDERIEIIEGTVENINNLKLLLDGCHIVINTFGQPPKDEPIYSSLTKNIFEVMKEFEINRYICVTGGSLNIKGDKKTVLNKIGAKLFEIFFSKMMKDKKEELTILQENTGIEWTLIRLPFVVEGSELGNIKESLSDMPGTKITNKDIASFIINQIENRQYIHQTPFIAT